MPCCIVLKRIDLYVLGLIHRSDNNFVDKISVYVGCLCEFNERIIALINELGAFVDLSVDWMSGLGSIRRIHEIKMVGISQIYRIACERDD